MRLYYFFTPKKGKENHADISKLGILLLFKRTEVMNPKNRPDHRGALFLFLVIAQHYLLLMMSGYLILLIPVGSGVKEPFPI